MNKKNTQIIINNDDVIKSIYYVISNISYFKEILIL